MKTGRRRDSSKAVVLGIIVMAFLTHSAGMGMVISLNLPPTPKISSEFTLVNTNFKPLKSDMLMNFSGLRLADSESDEMVSPTPALSSSNTEQVPLLTPQTSTFKPVRKNNTFFITAVSATVLLQAADYLTTLNALKYSNLQEGNPLLKNITDSPVLFAAVKLCVTGLQIALLKKLHDSNRTLGWIVGTALNVAVSYVVANNINKIQSARGL